MRPPQARPYKCMEVDDDKHLHPPSSFTGIKTRYSWWALFQTVQNPLLCTWRVSLAGAHHHQGVLDRIRGKDEISIRGKDEISTRGLCCFLRRIVGLVLGSLGQLFLPWLFCAFQHHLWAVFITHNISTVHGRKEFPALQDKTNTEGEKR